MSGVIQMTRLGSHGRWANCLFQSAFLAVYAKQHDLRVEAPMFPGQDRLSFRFDPVSCRLPDAYERYAVPQENCGSENMPPEGDEFVNKNWSGYAQFRTTWYVPYREMIQTMWTPQDNLSLPSIDTGATWIGLHHRAGDYDNVTMKWRCPRQWYLDWLRDNWSRFKNPRLFVSLEDRRNIEWFREYDPLMLPNDNFVDDWTMLTLCDVLLIPNSTFSFAAAMAGTYLKEAWRATLPARGFERFDPWNDTPLHYEKIENYPDIRRIVR